VGSLGGKTEDFEHATNGNRNYRISIDKARACLALQPNCLKISRRSLGTLHCSRPGLAAPLPPSPSQFHAVPGSFARSAWSCPFELYVRCRHQPLAIVGRSLSRATADRLKSIERLAA